MAEVDELTLAGALRYVTVHIERMASALDEYAAQARATAQVWREQHG